MFSDIELHRYMLSEHQLTAAAQNYIIETRSSEPSRMVGKNANTNVCSWIVSEKMMSSTVSVESRSAERAFYLMCEYDDRILEIWPQCPAQKIEKYDKNGRLIKGSYTPDFLILTKDGPRVIEVKTRDGVDKLIETHPGNWKDSFGVISYDPAVHAFESIGLPHNVFVFENFHGCKVENLYSMIRSRSKPNEYEGLIAALDELFDESFYWSLAELKDRLLLTSYTGLFQLFDKGVLFFDIDNVFLTSPQSVIVVRTLSLLDEAKTISSKKITITASTNSISFCEVPSEKYAQEALERLARIDAGESSRSVRRWKSNIVAGLAVGLTRFQSVISKKYFSGNRRARINNTIMDFLINYLVDVHSELPGLSKYRSYCKYKDLASVAHPDFDPVSWRTFYLNLSKIPAFIIALGRGGKRAANAVSEPTDPEKRLFKSDAPWKLASIDHYLADIFLIFFSDNGVVHVKRPWITAMVDVCTSKVLAFSISFSDPSRKSVAKVLRACVRGHGKLPAEIIVDRGSEFKSVYFASLLAHLGITYSLRPASHSRYGSEVEGLFGDFKRMWLSQRPGNLADYKEARAVDGNKAPKKSAVLKPYDLFRELGKFLEWRDHKPKGIYSESTSDRFQQGEMDFPFFSTEINYDQNFLIATAVEQHTYSIDFARGLHIDDQYYWSPLLGNLRGKKSKTEVRKDPENPHLVYANVDRTWVSCFSSHARRYETLDLASQFSEGLTVSEARIARKNIAENADVDLARIIREMDAVSESGSNKTPIINFEIEDEEVVDTVSIFEKIKNTVVRELSTGEW